MSFYYSFRYLFYISWPDFTYPEGGKVLVFVRVEHVRMAGVVVPVSKCQRGGVVMIRRVMEAVRVAGRLSTP